MEIRRRSRSTLYVICCCHLGHLTLNDLLRPVGTSEWRRLDRPIIRRIHCTLRRRAQANHHIDCCVWHSYSRHDRSGRHLDGRGARDDLWILCWNLSVTFLFPSCRELNADVRGQTSHCWHPSWPSLPVISRNSGSLRSHIRSFKPKCLYISVLVLAWESLR